MFIWQTLGERMRYNVYKVLFRGQFWEVCEASEQRARIACAHSNRKPVSWVRSCEKIGETDHPYIKLIG